MAITQADAMNSFILYQGVPDDDSGMPKKRMLKKQFSITPDNALALLEMR